MAEPITATTPETQAEQKSLLDPAFLRHLEQLGLISKKTFMGRMKGERRSKKRGVSIEFADYRDYSKGDDLRFLDWNIYGRLDRLFTKLFHEEEDLYLYVVLDTSASMDYGNPNKAWFAKRAAAALSYISLSGMDRVCLVGFNQDQYQWIQPTRGKGNIWRIVSFLEDIRPTGETTLTEGCRRFALQQNRGGVVILLSDLFDPNGYEDAFKHLLQRNNELYVFQTLAPEEARPDMIGALRLLDVETSEQVEITVTEELLNVYERRLKAFQSQIKNTCIRYGIHYSPIITDEPLERLLADSFRRMGLIE